MGESIKESISKSLKFVSKPFPLDNIEDINPWPLRCYRTW